MDTAERARLDVALAGRYRLGEPIGRGGMATVYRAEDLRHGRTVAVKVLSAEVGLALGAERFLREIGIAARLNHPHVLPLLDSGEADGRLFYVMPCVAGGSLRTKLEREGRLPVDEALRLVREAALALHHAHERGLVHRDVKPENILLHEGEAMVADFGVALALDGEGSGGAGDRLTLTGVVLGTPAYMSPEQATGDPSLDARSDVYALACVLFELLTGAPPFTGGPRAVLLHQVTTPAPSVRTLRPAVADAVDRALATALAKERAERFPSAAAFAAALVAAPASRRAEPPVVAVLPFAYLGAGEDTDCFAEGITADVVANLSKVGTLRVIARASVLRATERTGEARGIGALLGATALLEGSVRRHGDRVRIVAQLVDAASGRHLWAETYDRRLTDIFAIQTDVALSIVAALRAELTADERTRIARGSTSDLRAYQLYVQGRHWRNRFDDAGALKAIDYFERAVAEDPGYALAHAAIAEAHAELLVSGSALPPDVLYRRAMDEVTRALALDATLGDAHDVRALLRFVHDFDWAEAEAELRLALELGPSNADARDHYAWLCGAMGRFDEAVEMARRAEALDPLAHRSDVAAALLRAGRNEEAEAVAARLVEFDPAYARAHSTLGWARFRLGRHADGLAILEHAAAIAPTSTMHLAQLAQAHAMAGDERRARELLGRLEAVARERYVTPYHFAYAYTGLGEHDAAITLLERAFAERSGAIYGVGGSFLFEPLRPHPRFQALLRRMNLPPRA